MREPPGDPSLLLDAGFVFLAVAMVGLLAWRIRSIHAAIVGLFWLGFTAFIAGSGWLSDFTGTPPRITLLLVPSLLLTISLGLSPFGKRFVALPLALLVGYQAFRIPVELLIHQAVVEEIAPPQMTWSGKNLDILTGLSALVLFPFANRVPKWALLVWNTFGLFLLIWVVAIAALSIPGTLQRLAPDNIWIAFFPFIWLPTILVTTALLGHVVLYRKLLSKDSAH